MSQVTRNLLALLVVGFMLFSYPNADAQYQSYEYSIEVDKYDFWPDRTSYDIKIRDKSRYNPCRYGCIKPDMVCANGIHVPRVPDMFEKYQTLKQQRQRERLMTAETELLEAQTALVRHQLQKIEDAERYKHNQRLVYGHTKKQRENNSPKRTNTSSDFGSYPALARELIEEVRTNLVTPGGAVIRYEKKGGNPAYMSGMLKSAGLSNAHRTTRTHQQSTLSKLAVKLGLKKSHRCTADCVD